MEAQSGDANPSKVRVTATLNLGPETYSVRGEKGRISEQLFLTKEETMKVLKNFITEHNVPNDVPDEPLEGSSEDDDEVLEKPPVMSKKRK